MGNYNVYVHTFPNMKRYVGLTKQKPEIRWGFNGWGYHNQPVYKAIEEFGWINIKHEVVATDLEIFEAQELEKLLIEKYDSINNGYNISTGGGLGSECWCEFEYNGEIYTAKELAEMSRYDLSYHDITNRINEHGWTVEKAISTPKGRKNVEFQYNGKSYTVKELYNMRINKDLTYLQIKNRLLKYNWDVERAITQSSNNKKQPHGIGTCIFEYNGKQYNSWELCQISKLEDLKPQDITDRINRRGWSVERAITQPKRKR